MRKKCKTLDIKLAHRLLTMLLAILMVMASIPIGTMGIQQAEVSVSGQVHAPLDLGEVTDHWTSNIAPGVTQTTIDVKSDLGPQKIFVLDVGASDSVISFEAGLANEKILGMQPTSEQAKAVSREGHVVVGGVNADFHCTFLGFPIGIMIHEGRILSSPNQRPAVGFLKNRKAIIGYPVLECSYSVSKTTHQINHINKPSGAGLVLYTSDYGDSTQTGEQHTEVILKKQGGQAKSGSKLTGIVQRVVSGQGDHRLDENTFILSSAGTAAETLKNLKVGDVVEISFNLLGEWHNVQEAVGGGPILLENGQVASGALQYKSPAPRTAVGIRADGSILLVVVDGRAPGYSEGINTQQLAQLMKNLGAVSALNLDGGGSSTQIARIPGHSQVSVSNRPSDSTERGVANSLLVISKAGQGELHQLAVFPERVRILAGGTVDFEVKGIDAAFNPASLHDEVTWKIENDIGVTDSEGLFTAGAKAGIGNVEAISGDATGSAKVIVVDELTEIIFPQKEMSVDPGSRVSFEVKAYKDGKLIITNSSQFKWEVTGDIGSVDEQGVLTVANKEARGVITASHGQVSISMELETGRLPVLLEDFEDGAEDWTVRGFRYNSVDISLATYPDEPVRFGKHSLRLEYDFLNTKGTSGIEARRHIEIDGYPKKIGMWVYGDGHKHWLRAQMRDGNNKAFPINFTEAYPDGVTWTGWRYVKADVPAGKMTPLKLDIPVRYMATSAAKSKGVIYIDNIRAVYHGNR